VNRHVNAIAGRLSLRPPQRQSLEILDRITEIVPPRKGNDVVAALAAIRSEYPSVTDFEREFPSVCFALATGVGKTRLMGAFISYLHLAHGLANFFVLAPNLTIYNKLITDFTPNTPKYVFKGIAEFATDAPQIITGDDYETSATTLFDDLLRCKVNIFNISKINSEVRGGKSPRIKRLSEYIGQSYFEYLAQLPDLVLIMDESHRYRASAGVRAINELNPVMGLELTATPFVETSRGATPFKNVILDYPLGRAMADGFVKEPAVVTRRDFNPSGMSQDEIERMKLEDGIRLHESVKVQLETYARETDKEIVKPFLLVIARDTTHASQLVQLIQSGGFFDGNYKEKVIQVDSSRTGAEEDEMVERLLKVEHPDEPTEIVIHVNMLKEGWDVTNLYTIVPLRAAHARVLIEQSIGRGLRLPYGRRTGVTAVDRLNIVAHDRFQEIVDEANKSDSAIRLQQVVLEPDELQHRMVTVVSPPVVDVCLGTAGAQQALAGFPEAPGQAPIFSTPADLRVAAIARDVIRTLESTPLVTPSVTFLTKPDVLAHIVGEVERHVPAQLELQGIPAGFDIPAVVAAVANAYVRQTIDIPRILVVPRGEVRSGFRGFTLDLGALKYPPVSDEIWIQHLRTGQTEVVALGEGGIEEERLEDYVVVGLVDFDDVSYDDHADLLYELAGQVVGHFRGYLSEDQARKVLRCYQRDIARFVHVQMQAHHWEESAGYDVQITRGFTELKESAYTAYSGEPVLDYRLSPADKSRMARYLFGGFSKCLYGVQKFQSEAERKLCVILERDSLKWFRPALGQFQIYYKTGADQQEYQPDFVAEIESAIFMLECKASNELESPEVLAKRDAAVLWCGRASDHAATYGGKPWVYFLIPHDVIAENMTLGGFAGQFAHVVRSSGA
jgi:type III restriction enzyme